MQFWYAPFFFHSFQLLQSILLFFTNDFKEQTRPLFTHRSNRTSCAKQNWRTNNLYGSQAAKIKATSQSFSLSHKLREKAKESLKICPHTPLHPFYFHKIMQVLRLKSLWLISLPDSLERQGSLPFQMHRTVICLKSSASIYIQKRYGFFYML